MLSRASQLVYLLWVHAVPVHQDIVVSQAQRGGQWATGEGLNEPRRAVARGEEEGKSRTEQIE